MITRIALFLTFVLICCSAVCSLGQATAADTNEAVTKLANTMRSFLDGQSTKEGVTVEFRETTRGNVQGRLTVKYHAIVHGAPADELFSAYAWPINAAEPQQILEGVSIAANGVAVCAGRKPGQCGSADKPDDPIDFAFFPAPGEPVRIALISEDQSLMLMFGAVPDPVSRTDHGCALEAIRLLPKWEAVLVRGMGFKPNEKLSMKSDSAGEIQQSEASASEKGSYVGVLLPFVKGKSTGRDMVRLAGTSCSPSVSFEWGKL